MIRLFPFVGHTVVLCTLALAQPIQAAAPIMFGVNLAGGEFNSNVLPGSCGTNYIYPNDAEFAYYQSKGLTFIRVPFRWERIQHTLNAPLNTTEMGRLDTVIGYARNRGMKVLLDMHNYNNYTIAGAGYQVGSAQVPYSAFQNVWGQIADRYKNENAIYGYDLMNEPGGTLANWQAAAQAAVNTIRQFDTVHYVFVEGVNWSGAQSWAGSNATLQVNDPVNLLVYSAHSYWDGNHDGVYESNEAGRPSKGIDSARPFVEWIKAHGYNGHIGEYGTPDTYSVPSWNTSLDNFLCYLRANNISGTYWAGGLWWGDYAISCEPSSNYTVDSAQMTALQKAGNGVALPWSNMDIGTVGLGGSASYDGEDGFTQLGAGLDIWGAADSFHFVHQPVSGDCSFVTRVMSQAGGSTSAKACIMIREQLTAGSTQVSMHLLKNGWIEFLYRGTTNGTTTKRASISGMTAPCWLRLTRTGNSFAGFHSTDGVTWTALGTPVTVTMNSNVFVGPGVCSKSTTALSTAIFDQTTLYKVPAPWLNDDIGAVAQTGTAAQAAGTFTVEGSGWDIWGTADSFQYVYQPSAGDCSITARVSSSDAAKACIMIREQLTAGSPHAVLQLTSTGGADFLVRSTLNGTTAKKASTAGMTVPRWLRLTRTGNVFASYHSADGVTWTQVGTGVTVNMAANAYIGLVVCDKSAGIGTVSFTDVTATP